MTQIYNMPKFLQSSVGDGSLSLTIKGLLIGLVPTMISLFQFYGYNISENVLINIIENVFAIISLITITYGLLRKLYYSFK